MARNEAVDVEAHASDTPVRSLGVWSCTALVIGNIIGAGFFLAPAPLIIAKANVRSNVHRRTYMDYIGVKIYDASGEITGELRIVGLFTSVAYTHSPKNIPFLRHKVDLVVRRSGYPPNGHSGKALLNVIETYPRDELFQIDVNLLYKFAIDIQSLELKPRTRVYPRIDEFDRFVAGIDRS